MFDLEFFGQFIIELNFLLYCGELVEKLWNYTVHPSGGQTTIFGLGLLASQTTAHIS